MPHLCLNLGPTHNRENWKYLSGVSNKGGVDKNLKKNTLGPCLLGTKRLEDILQVKGNTSINHNPKLYKTRDITIINILDIF